MHSLAQRFDLASLLSSSGHESDCGDAESEPPLEIGTSEAADILGVSPRHVRRLTADLDGELRLGRLIFRLDAVQAYAEGKRDGRPG